MLFCKFGFAPNFNNSDNTFKLFAIIDLYTGVHPFSFCILISDISEQYNLSGELLNKLFCSISLVIISFSRFDDLDGVNCIFNFINIFKF